MIRQYLFHKQESFCKVVLTMNGVTFYLRALIDNGNGLVEPFSKKAVSVVEKSIFPSDMIFLQEKYRVIPFHALGTEKGILDGYEADLMKIEKGAETINVKNPIIAISTEYVSGKKNYQMILHPDLLREREEVK